MLLGLWMETSGLLLRVELEAWRAWRGTEASLWCVMLTTLSCASQLCM